MIIPMNTCMCMHCTLCMWLLHIIMQRIPDTDEIPHLRDSIVKLLQDFQVQVGLCYIVLFLLATIILLKCKDVTEALCICSLQSYITSPVAIYFLAVIR